MTRVRAVAWLLLAVAAIGGFVTGAQPWWTAATASRSVPITGIDSAAGLPQALAAVTAAGLLLSLTLRGWGRVLLGGVLALAGVGAVILGVASPEPATEVIARLVQQVSLDPVTALDRGWGGYGFAAAGVLAVLGGLGLVVAGRGASGRADRFGRTREARLRATAPDDDPLEVWRALDAGVDPTAGPGDQGAEPPARRRG